MLYLKAKLKVEAMSQPSPSFSSVAVVGWTPRTKIVKKGKEEIYVRGAALKNFCDNKRTVNNLIDDNKREAVVRKVKKGKRINI